MWWGSLPSIAPCVSRRPRLFQNGYGRFHASAAIHAAQRRRRRISAIYFQACGGSKPAVTHSRPSTRWAKSDADLRLLQFGSRLGQAGVQANQLIAVDACLPGLFRLVQLRPGAVNSAAAATAACRLRAQRLGQRPA